MRPTLFILAIGLAGAACAPMSDSAARDDLLGGPDQCKASRHQDWVGKTRSELPPKPAGETWRVTCTTCAVTMDYSPARLNVFYDEATGIIEQVKCG